MSSRWELYFCDVDGAIASFVVDLALAARAPVAGHPYLLRIRLAMRNSREDGLSSAEDAPTLGKTEAALESWLCGVGAIYAGRYTARSFRTFFFYCPDAAQADFVATVCASCTAFVEEDPRWNTYLEFLYPDTLALQSIANRTQCEACEFPDTPLELEHRVSSADPAAFLDAAKALGFRAVNRDDTGVIRIVRADVISLETIDQITHPLMKLAAGFDGEYLGWEVYQSTTDPSSSSSLTR